MKKNKNNNDRWQGYTPADCDCKYCVYKDISTTLNIYTDVTKELRKSEFEGLDSYFKNEYNKVSV